MPDKYISSFGFNNFELIDSFRLHNSDSDLYFFLTDLDLLYDEIV